ncbi:60S ribosomal protein L36a [Galemys pyrenaicus]|uniref:60S ribosomal protein L36a n=1 Tax=Galemys pyrenaicus TaxID=202257 RepID=A0A8J5ZMF4_GALPY|nr:60S ribosomal protein L36a [Galemys pyrenaicus]
MVNAPKTRWTFCKKCGKHQPHKVTQHKKGEDSLYAQGKRRLRTSKEWETSAVDVPGVPADHQVPAADKMPTAEVASSPQYLNIRPPAWKRVQWHLWLMLP